MMDLLLFLYSLLLASFFNVVGLRVPVGESIIRPRSHCPACGRTLSAMELIPVVSYVAQKGRCKGCGGRISPLYPLMELTTAALLTAAPMWIGWGGRLIVAWTLISLLAIIVVSDLRYMLIPDRVLLVFAGLFLMERLVIPFLPWVDMLIGAAVGFSLLWLIAVLSNGGMGGGDVKLFAVLGMVLGWKMVLLAFFLATLYGTIIGLIGMALGRVRRGKPMPFAPAIALGSLTALFFGDQLVDAYMDLFV
ncbi:MULTISPECIES: prepilin peptidase [Geobacillus]|uniref:Prepilin leader peptidase/N-methyltransferase n=2 Tax=Geobacillus TaxID=129337 RepID=A0ABU6BEI4_9BACL|nr:MULTISPECIES: A24 family peptidase [Geobacillus]AUI38330.1 prepilin peptidase [[Bacillus] caldolyticus]MEB3750311.1 Type 4 prepilin-like proteins leader peptide-processing enzyme [Geobacillus icigianus]MED3668387.1 A24 family peptidase [Geobacillus kaustophilus]MED4870094.1 A24 family peptidase [Geobacillus stearothermophilus]MED4986011.1 A24 family peptidase [Geobacillus stearothermophilus]